MADDEMSELAGALVVEQIMLRALLREVVKRLAQQSSNPEQAIREAGESFQDFVNGYRVPETDEQTMERAKEQARMNLDALIKSFEHNG
jgi:hypothetical protein